MSEFLQRLFKIADTNNQAEIARQLGIPTTTLSNWVSRGVSKSGALKISKFYGVDIDYVLGQSEALKPSIDKEKHALGNIETVKAKPARYAPVLNYVQAGAFTAIGDNGYDEYLPYDDEKISDNAYWLIVKGDSMMPDFQEGDYLLIDANRQPKSGDYVIAMIDNENEATFKRYKCGFDAAINKEYFQLIALNEFYSPIDSRHRPFIVIGVVVEHKRKLI